MAGITWLHLSDWHQKGKDFDRQVVRDALKRDIKEREKISHDLAKIDFIIFSGDVAWSGKKEEYEAAQKYLFDHVLEATGLPAERLFIVPGNHDLDRDIVYELLPYSMQKPFESKYQNNNNQVKNWLMDNRKRDRLLEPFEAYREFVTKYTGHISPDYGCVQTIKINGKRVALLGLNSALMAGRKKETEEIEEINDDGKLIVGEPQLYDALNRITSCDVRIAVLHHPLELLAEFERGLITQRLQNNYGCHFLLCGHQHKAQAYQVTGTTGNCVIIPAGSSYSNRDYHNGYNFVHLDFATSKGIVYLRCWSHIRNEWITETELADNGQQSFSLPEKKIEKIVLPIDPHEPKLSPREKAELENHFEVLVSKIRDGLVVPFLGADINLCDRLENPEQIPFPSTWDIHNEFPPTSVELAAYLDQRERGEYLQNVRCPLCDIDTTLPRGCPIKTLFVTRLDLQNVSQYLSIQGKKNIQETITEIAKLNKYKPNKLHKFLAELPRLMDDMGYSAQIKNESGGDATRYQLIVTTNFDSTLESAFIEAKQPFDLVSYTVDNQVKQFVHQKFDLEKTNTESKIVNKGEDSIPPGATDKYSYNFLQERPVILKLYGPVNWTEHPIKSFAITEDNFIDYLAYADSNPQNLLPVSLLDKLKNSHIWFLGYSLRYWHQRVILRRLLPMKAHRVKDWYVVHPKLDVLDKSFLWKANDVHHILETSLENYIEELNEKLKQRCYE
ncbi:MAG TPA: SIR2 family protein [Leptolyngbyaceae cyanobacterium]